MLVHTGAGQIAQNLRDLSLEIGNVLSNHCPDNFYVDSQIVVNKNVSESGQRRPLDFRIDTLEVGGEPLSCFSHCVEIAENGILVESGLNKDLFARSRSDLDTADHFQDVLQVGPVVFSQCNRLGQYLIPKQWIESWYRDNIDVPPKELLEFQNQAGGEPGADAGSRGD